jgi:hypothetical protein
LTKEKREEDMKRFEIQPVVIKPFQQMTISGHLFSYLRREADNRGISPSETARQLILWHLGLNDERLWNWRGLE